MIILTIDFKNSTMSMTSIMRDIYADIPGYDQQKINAAYAYGGPELTLETINQNFDTNLAYYVTVDFQALVSIVNLVGGVEVDIKDYELEEVNRYIGDMNRILAGEPSALLEKTGSQLLDGRQATAYCRIRYAGNADYERTERQRRVLSAIVGKMSDIGPTRLPQAVVDVMPLTETNMGMAKITQLGMRFLINKPSELQTYRIPAANTFDNDTVNGMAVLDINWEKNIALLREIMTGEKQGE
jgi:LCP family protein required for cell wall assembly